MVFHLYERFFGNYGDPKSFKRVDDRATHLVLPDQFFSDSIGC